MAITKMGENKVFHVMVVDDNMIDRKVVEKLLRAESYEVSTVDSGRKALELLGGQLQRNNNFGVDMIITDYCMPGMTGYELLKTVKDNSKLKDIPVVIMSSENEPARKTKCLNEGAEEFINKPVQKSEISRMRAYIMKSTQSKQMQLK